MSIIHKVTSFLSLSKKRVFWFISLALIFLLIIGSIVFFVYKLKKQSLEYAVANINKAIEEDDLVLLNMYVDLNLLSKEFVQNIMEYWPKIKLEDEHRKELEYAIQQKIVVALKGDVVDIVSEESPDKTTPPEFQAVKQKSFFDFLPNDFNTQLKKQKIVIHRQDKDIAILSLSINHKKADYFSEIKLLAQKLEDKWYVTKIINGYDLIQLHMDALSKKNKEVESAWHLYNESIYKQMNQYYHVTNCEVFFEPQQGNTANFVLTIIVDGVNKAKESIRSAGMQCSLYDKGNKLLTTLPLNSVRRLTPEEQFRQKWFFDVTELMPELWLLTKEHELTCKIKLSSIMLSNGKFIYTATPLDLKQVHP